MDIGWGVGVAVNAIVGTTAGASVGFRVGTLVGATVAASKIGAGVEGAGLQLLMTIRITGSKIPGLIRNVFTLASHYTLTIYLKICWTFAVNRSSVLALVGIIRGTLL
jgi:hypothetical protein